MARVTVINRNVSTTNELNAKPPTPIAKRTRSATKLTLQSYPLPSFESCFKHGSVAKRRRLILPTRSNISEDSFRLPAESKSALLYVDKKNECNEQHTILAILRPMLYKLSISGELYISSNIFSIVRKFPAIDIYDKFIPWDSESRSTMPAHFIIPKWSTTGCNKISFLAYITDDTCGVSMDPIIKHNSRQISDEFNMKMCNSQEGNGSGKINPGGEVDGSLRNAGEVLLKDKALGLNGKEFDFTQESSYLDVCSKLLDAQTKYLSYIKQFGNLSNKTKDIPLDSVSTGCWQGLRTGAEKPPENKSEQLILSNINFNWLTSADDFRNAQILHNEMHDSRVHDFRARTNMPIATVPAKKSRSNENITDFGSFPVLGFAFNLDGSNNAVTPNRNAKLDDFGLFSKDPTPTNYLNYPSYGVSQLSNQNLSLLSPINLWSQTENKNQSVAEIATIQPNSFVPNQAFVPLVVPLIPGFQNVCFETYVPKEVKPNSYLLADSLQTFLNIVNEAPTSSSVVTTLQETGKQETKADSKRKQNKTKRKTNSNRRNVKKKDAQENRKSRKKVENQNQLKTCPPEKLDYANLMTISDSSSNNVFCSQNIPRYDWNKLLAEITSNDYTNYKFPFVNAFNPPVENKSIFQLKNEITTKYNLENLEVPLNDLLLLKETEFLASNVNIPDVLL